MWARQVTGGSALVVHDAAVIPPILALAAEQLDLDLEACPSREAAERVLTSDVNVVLLVVGPDALTTSLALADARPDTTRVLLADDRSLPMAVDVLNAAGALAIGRLDGGPAALGALIGRAVAEVRHRTEERRVVLALRSALEQARSALAQAEERVVAVRGQIDVESGLWDTMRLVEKNLFMII